MGRKNSSNLSEPIEEEEQLTMEEKVQNSIKKLSTLEEKVQAIAINQYLLEKRALDKKLEAQINKIETTDRKTYEPLLAEIYNIISGQVDLTDADFEGVDEILTEQQKQTKANYYPKKQLEEYWLKALMSSEEAGQEVSPDDEGPLKHLMNITASRTEDGKNLTVIFHFSENEWFTNKEIKKQFEIDGDNIKRSFGDAIEWKEGKNLTVEIVKKKNKKKKTTTTKQVKKQSFFNIFAEIDLTSDNEDEEPEDEEQDTEVQELEKQYEICNAIYQQILPRSLEHYLGLVSSLGNLNMGELQDLQQEEDEDAEKPKKKNKKRKASENSKE